MPGINKDTSGVASNTSATRAAVLSFAQQLVNTPVTQQESVGLMAKDARLFATEFLRLYNEKGGGDEANKPGPDHFETRELGLGMAVKLHEGEDVVDPARLVYMTLLCDMLLSRRFDEQLIEFAKKGEHPNRVLEIWAQG